MSDEPWGRDRLAELGVDETAPLTTPPEELVRISAALASTVQLDREAGLEHAAITTNASTEANVVLMALIPYMKAVLRQLDHYGWEASELRALLPNISSRLRQFLRVGPE